MYLARLFEPTRSLGLAGLLLRQAALLALARLGLVALAQCLDLLYSPTVGSTVSMGHCNDAPSANDGRMHPGIQQRAEAICTAPRT